MVLIRNSQLLAATGTAGCQYTTAILRCHSLAETMLVHAAAVVWLECSFHCPIYLLFIIILRTVNPIDEFTPFWVAKVHIIFELTKNYAKFHHEKDVFL